MTRVLGALLLMAALSVPAAGADSGPHRDDTACDACHNDDMTLSMPKAELCVLCHSQTVHSGAFQHLNAGAEEVRRRLETAGKAEPELPLTDDGRIFCGTCHLFHPPSIGEDWLSQGWVPPSTGFPGAVRRSLQERFQSMAGKYGETSPQTDFVTEPTRALRLPVDNGALCLRCHGGIRK